MIEKIENRIQELMAERSTLQTSHSFTVEQNQKINQEFQQTVMKNQTRFAQLTGGITELQQLLDNNKENHHEYRIPTINLSNRIADVCVGEQPESR